MIRFRMIARPRDAPQSVRLNKTIRTELIATAAAQVRCSPRGKGIVTSEMSAPIVNAVVQEMAAIQGLMDSPWSTPAPTATVPAEAIARAVFGVVAGH